MSPTPDAGERTLLPLLVLNSQKEPFEDGETRWSCQGTEMSRAAPEKLPLKQLSQYRDDVVSGNVGVLALVVTPKNVSTLPQADCVLCLSVWHHFVREYGFVLATRMLRDLWGLSRRALVFDTGEAEMTADYGLPAMLPDARTWLSAYLEETCPAGTVEHLGRHQAFEPGGSPCERNLFAVIRA